MYLLAKLTSLAGIILSAGTAVAFLFPYFQSQKLDVISNLLYDEDTSIHNLDFKTLEEQAERNIKLLNEKIERLKGAKDETNHWGEKIYEYILKIFEYLSNIERKLTDLYEEIISEIKKLVERNKEISRARTKKLNIQKGQKLNSVLERAYIELIKTFSTWKFSINQINCAIKKSKDCEKNNTGTHNDLTPGGGANSSKISSEDVTGAEKAQQELNEIKEKFEDLIFEIEKNSDSKKTSWLAIFAEEKILLSSASYLENLLNWLNKQRNNLSAEILTKNEKAEKLLKTINELKRGMKSLFQHYERLQKQEITLHYWQSKLEDILWKNENDLNREVKVRL